MKRFYFKIPMQLSLCLHAADEKEAFSQLSQILRQSESRLQLSLENMLRAGDAELTHQQGEVFSLEYLEHDEEDCSYCGATLYNHPPDPPAVDDEEDWTHEAKLHKPGCEWVSTRDHSQTGDSV